MIIHIDTNTFPASPALYADAEKTKALPRILPAVELQRGGFEVAFLGANQPQDIATVSLAASIEGTQTQVVAEIGRESETEDAWQFDFALNSEALVAEVAKHGSARLRVGVIVEDDTERREWQLVAVVYPSASGEASVEQVESAKNFAELAEQAAKRAQEAQADVAGNAQLAENAKQTATQAANAAIGAADSAEVSERNAAEFKDAAEQAKADAEAAKAAAQKAASDAQATLSNVYTKAEIDGVATGAEVTLKMNEIIAQLKDWEEVTGEKLPFEFWEAVMAEFQRWQENPNEVKEWRTKKDNSGNVVSFNPYYKTPPTKPVVDFNVRAADSWVDVPRASFNANTNVPIFLPRVIEMSVCISSAKTFNQYFIAQNATNTSLAFYGCVSFSRPLSFPASKNCSQMLKNATAFNQLLYIPNATNCNELLRNAKAYNQWLSLPSCSSALYAFANTAMSAENISKTLDSLPPWTDGASHVISFMGSPGASELTQDSPSVAAAVAKGWTVEL